MPATLVEQPLGIACLFSDGSSAKFAWGGEPACPRLARELLTGLAELVHPHGQVDAAATVATYVRAARDMVATLAGGGVRGGLAEVSRAQLGQYWMGATVWNEGCTRRMLQGLLAADIGVPAGVRELIAGRAFNPQPVRRPLPPYPDSEWARLTRTCQRVVAESYQAHNAALAAAGRGHDPHGAGWHDDNLCWLLARRGPSTLVEVALDTGRPPHTARSHGGYARASTQLFPHLDTAVAYMLLFGIYSGVVPDGVADLVLTDIDWAGDASVLLSYVKGRTGTESVNLPRRAVRLLEQWLAHSALLRGFAGPDQRRHLWLRVAAAGTTTLSWGQANRAVIRRWARRHQVTGDDGQPLKIHRSRIRTTHHATRDTRSWTGGRATIDPNHSAQVEGDHYLTAASAAQRQAVEAIIEDAQHDLLRRAHPPVVLGGDQAEALARDYPRLVADLGLGEQAVAELAGGHRDVFTAACADQLSGLHGPKGQPCPARPWVCLLCPLAVFAPRHAGNLLRLKEFFTRQWQAMPATQFMAVFGPYSQRVHQVLDRFDPAVLSAAARSVTGSDNELPLRPEERTT
jgi:hypothetical protein